MQRKTMQLTIRVDEALDAALRRAAEAEQRSVGDVARRLLGEALGIHLRRREGIGQGVKDALVARSIPDVSAEELLGAGAVATVGGPMSLSTTKTERLAAARAAVAAVPTRRGYVGREVGPSKLLLEQRADGESRVEPLEDDDNWRR
jgi:hypothetical protein